MRIHIISQYFFPEQFSNNSIALALKDRGHEIQVTTCVPNYGRDTFFKGYSNKFLRSEVWSGIPINRAWTVARGKSKFRLLLNYLTFPITGSIEAGRHGAKRASVSFVSMPSPLFQAFVGIYLKRRYGTPTVYWVQDIWPESPILTLGIRNAFAKRLLHIICGWIYRQADLVLVQSQGFVKYVERYGVERQKIRVLPNTAPEGFAPKPKSTESSRKGVFSLMFAGNIGESQDFETIVETAEILRNEAIEWVIVGAGRRDAWLRAEINDRRLAHRFRFIGQHPQDMMPQLFAQADAMIVSLKKSDIFALTVPYKIQCYLACGRPIIGSINGEAARIIEQSGAGWAVEASRPDLFAKAVRKMAALPDSKRDALGKAGRQYFDAYYSADRVYGDLEEWLAEAANLKPSN